MSMKTQFENWWREEGSAAPLNGAEDLEEHTRRMCEIAWSNGAFMGWHPGTPDVRSGAREAFWCVTRTAEGKLAHRHLVYCNGHIMPLADSCDEPPSTAVAVDEDGEEYAWTGWHEESCDQCETQWAFSDQVVAWMRLPRYDEGGAK